MFHTSFQATVNALEVQLEVIFSNQGFILACLVENKLKRPTFNQQAR